MTSFTRPFVAITTLALLGCGDAPKAGPVDAAIDAPIDAAELPAPADDTVEMALNGQRYTLVRKEFCRDGTTGIGFELSDVPPDTTPTLFLHNVDFTAMGTVLIKTGSAWHMDIDFHRAEVNAVFGTTPAGCNAMVVNNTATIIELSAVACSLKNQFGSETATVSFRVRCTKGT